MEKIRLNSQYIPKPTKATRVYCHPDKIQKYSDEGCNELSPSEYIPSDSSDSYFIKVDVNKYSESDDPSKYPNFYEVKANVLEDTKVVNDRENSIVTEKENSMELVTVVEIE